MEDLLYSFKNLGGNNVGEHKRNFNYFCQKLDTLPKDEVNHLLASLNPKYLQEKIFHVRLLARFEKKKELYEIFYENNIVLNKIILNIYSRGFLEDLKAKEFIDEVCPKISFSMRMKIINKLSQQIADNKTADEFFNAVFNNFGMKIAGMLLINCSEELIDKALDVYRVGFKNKDLIKLYEKSSQLLIKYLQKDVRDDDVEFILRYLAVNDVHTFYKVLQLNTQFIGICRINLKGFINFIKNYSEFYIKHAINFYQLLPNNSWPYKYLSKNDFAIFLKNLCQSDHYQSFTNRIIPFVKPVPIKYRGEIIFETYRQIYDEEIWKKDVLPFYDINNLLEVLSVKDRLKFPITLDDQLEFCSTKEAFEYVKQKINLTQDIYIRQDLLSLIIRNCAIYKDKDALLEVLKYFCNRHKNDVLPVRESFLGNILGAFDSSFNEEHWKYIHELVLNIKTKDEIFLDERTYWETYILYKLSNNLDISVEIKEYIKLRGFSETWRILSKHPKWEKACLLKIRGELEECFLEKDDLNKAKVTLLETLHDWNKQHRRDQFDLYAYSDCIDALIGLSHQGKDGDYPSTLLPKVLLTNTSDSNKKCFYIENYIKALKEILCSDLLLWLIKHDPLLLEKYFYKIFKELPSKFEFYEISKMHWNGLADLFKAKAKKVLGDDGNAEIYEIIQALYILSHEDDFLKYIKRYVPEEDCVIDVYNTDVKNLLRIQREILQLFKNSSTPSKNLEVCLKFCAGDYLQFALHPLYFILNNTAEKNLSESLRTLSNRSVSVRKHAAFLTAKLSPISFVLQFFKDMCAAEKNAPVRKYLLKTIFTYFTENQNDDMFDLFKEQLYLVPEEDKESWSIFLDCNRVPVKYLSEYVIFLWNHIKDFELKSKFKLLEAFNEEVFKALSNDFCREIIDYCLFSSENNYNYSVEKFVYNYFKFGHVPVIDRVYLIVRKILNYKLSIGTQMAYKEVHKSINSLILEICSKLVSEKIDNFKASYLKNISSIILREFADPSFGVEFTEMKVMIRLTDSFVQLPEENTELLCKLIIDIQENLVAAFGTEILYLYINVVKSFINIIAGKKDDDMFMYKFLEIMNQNYTTTPAKLISLWLLPKNAKKSEEKRVLSNIVGMIRLNSNQMIDVYLHTFLLKI